MNTYDPYDYDDSTAPVKNTNRQIALMAAAKIYEGSKYTDTRWILHVARDFLKFLEEE